MGTLIYTEGQEHYEYLGGATLEPVLIRRELVDGTAEFGIDFTSFSRVTEKELQFPGKFYFSVGIVADGIEEGPEYFLIRSTTSDTEVIIQDRAGQFSELLLASPHDTTAVVAATYQFFTGAIPAASGFIYLIDSRHNEADLTDPYYAGFNQENRFLNFSANLAFHGEGADDFLRKFGALSFEQTIRRAYDEIVGFDKAVAAGNDIDTIVDYFLSARAFYETVATQRVLPGTAGVSLDDATKAVAIGSILNEAMKSGLGHYADAYEEFLGTVTVVSSTSFGVDMISAYGMG